VYRCSSSSSGSVSRSSSCCTSTRRRSTSSTILHSLWVKPVRDLVAGPATRVPNNGLIIYCGTILTEEGKEKQVKFDFEPFRPINTTLYMCDNKFHTEVGTTRYCPTRHRHAF